MSNVKEFTIDRSKWYRGNTGTNSALRREDGRQCCLGFFGVACGVPGEHLLGIGYPTSFYNGAGGGEWPSWLLTTEGAHKFVTINDNASIDGPSREQRLTELFAAHGVSVHFVDGPVSP